METSYDLPGQVIGLAMKVHRTLGPGFLESVYRQALAYELFRARYAVILQKPISVFYEETVVGQFYADLFVDGKLIVEVKAVLALAVSHEIQLVNYLVATKTDDGLLLNFGAKSLEFKRKFRLYRPTGSP